MFPTWCFLWIFVDCCGVFIPLPIFHKDAHTKPTAMQTWHLDGFGFISLYFAHVTGLHFVIVDEAAADAKYQKLSSEVDVLEMVQTGFEPFWLYARKLETCGVYMGTFLNLQNCAKTLSTVFNMWSETTKESTAAAVSTQQIAKQAPSANWLSFFEVQRGVLGCHAQNCAIDRKSKCILYTVSFHASMVIQQQNNAKPTFKYD